MSNFLVRGHCPACGSESSESLVNNKFTEPPLSNYLESFYRAQGTIDMSLLEDGSYILTVCGECSLLYQKEIPNNELMDALYEKWIDPDTARKLHECYGTEYYIKQMRELANIIFRLGDKPTRMRCLDFGMGWGIWCQIAKGFGCDVYGLELSHARNEYAKSKGIRVVTYDSIRNMEFDFINAEQVFEHIPSPLETLVSLKSVLSKTGIIKINVPDSWKIESKINFKNMSNPIAFRRTLTPIQPLEHINSFSYRSLVKMGEKAGLQVTSVPEHYIYSPLDLIKSAARPMFHLLRGSRSTRVYFTHA
jgi:hypothetical protein